MGAFGRYLLPLMKRLGTLVVAVIALALAGCDNPQRTVDTLQNEITAFKTTPDEKKQLEIEQNLAKLEAQVEKLQKKGDARADELAKELTALRTDYQAAKMAKALEDAKKALQGFGEALKDGVKSVGDVFRQSTNSTNE